MNRIKLILTIIFLIVISQQSYSEEQKTDFNEHEFSFYSGMFDFSDDGQRAVLFGMQHQNENLIKESFLGTISPITSTV